MSGYLVAAYAVFWAGTLVYVFSLAARQRSLAKKVDSLEAALADARKADEASDS